jgi:hypothetical protein
LELYYSGASVMALTVAQARTLLTESALHISASETFSELKKDRAIKDASDRFLRETHASTLTTNITIAAAATTANITSTISEFVAGQFIYAEISGQEVHLVPYETIRRRYDGDTPVVGRPTKIGFRRDNLVQFDRGADQAYTMELTYWVAEDTSSWTLGTTGSTTGISMRLPDDWADEVIRWGARGYLLRGAPGHPDANAAMEEFDLLIERAKPVFAHNYPVLPLVIPLPTRQARKKE